MIIKIKLEKLKTTKLNSINDLYNLLVKNKEFIIINHDLCKDIIENPFIFKS